jgi:DNA-binding LacI/PurR family transcriptional regulator
VDEFTVDAGRVGLERLVDLPDPPSAVFAAGETLAVGVLQEARSRKIDVPGDLAITGYTDSPTAALVEPPLTMVSVPAREIGLQAMRTLSQLIRGKKVRTRRKVLDVELVVRDSCGSH